VHTPHVHTPDYTVYSKGDGLLKRALGAAFIGYKKYISSQDGMNCVFHPSCSSYAIQSVQKKGVFLGGMAAIDRLTRCHGFSAKQYPVHPISKRLYDPVK
jgi:putative membrane protein insertion efficiency factor